MMNDSTRTRIESVGAEVSDEAIKSCSDFRLRPTAEIAGGKWWDVGPRHQSGHITFLIIGQSPHDFMTHRILNAAGVVPRFVRHKTPRPNEWPTFGWFHRSG